MINLWGGGFYRANLDLFEVKMTIFSGEGGRK